ncbi:MAG: F0F1 ATP synthase subunit A, partial [Hyphomonas sp.]|nr:F0F1 ATP synthase subunit A [Hyphomonas sp.]
MTLSFPALLPTIATDPIHQFKIFPLLDWTAAGYNLSFTNSSFWMLVSTALVLVFLGLAASRGGLIPNRIQSLGELSYGFIADMVRSTAGVEGLKLFPFVFTLFFFFLSANLVGMFPYAFTTTSHIAVTGALAIVVILIVIG